MDDCIFCKIIKGEIPSNKAYENEYVLAFHDIDKKAPVHILVIPKKHIQSFIHLGQEDYIYLEEIHKAVCLLAREYDLEEKGFRLVVNTGEQGGQTVNHLHFHLLGGRDMTWPPG